MSASGLDNTAIRTPERAKADRDRKDRAGWYPARSVRGDEHLIMSALSGRTVCICASEADRDFLLEAVRKAAQS